jgi:3-hydroxyisobutyrate dehydrogenase-like beta-hydroxyacid dehydrogenase
MEKNPFLRRQAFGLANMSEQRAVQRIAIIGFGEVGGIFGSDFTEQGINVSVFDILFHSKLRRKRMLAKARVCGVTAAENLKDCIDESQLVISAVTASSSLDVAKRASRILHDGQVFLDINSVSPETKGKAASYVEKSGAHFVEAAVMAPVPGARLKVPMLLGGTYAADAAEQLHNLGMNASALSDRIGVASAVKMCRSVMIKGLEALAVECLLAAKRYGAEDKVLESLATTYPSMGWDGQLPDYLISRVSEHGRRRAAEMREVATALCEVGIRPTMALATAKRQEQLVREMAKKKIVFDAKDFRWHSLADTLDGRRRRSARGKS